MTNWKISEAKARLSEVVAACVEEPQILYNRNEPVAALIDMEVYRAFVAYQEARCQPSMAELLQELVAINELEGDLPLPVRTDRVVPEFE